MSRFNFTNITLQDKADISDVMDNFNKIENTSAVIDDLTKVYTITLSKANWVDMGNKYEYTISHEAIKPEPYDIEIIFTDLTIITSPIYAKPNSQSDGQVILQTTVMPSVDLVANLLITRGFEQ